MPAITWTLQMSVGIHAIDTDHKLLISLINQFHKAVEEGQGQETVGSVLNALCDYTDYHFKREEELMEACSYADAIGHKQGHAVLRKKVCAIRDDYLAHPENNISGEVLDFMKTWLTKHILGSDMKYRPAMESMRDEIETANRAFSKRMSQDIVSGNGCVA